MWIRSCIGGWLLWLLLACGTSPTEQEKVAEAEADTDTAPARIVTVGGTMTEIVSALGLGERIVATDRTSVYPPAVRELPSVGHPGNFNAEGILAQQPDLVIAQDEMLSDKMIEQLRGATEVLVVENDNSVEGTRRMIRAVAQTLGRTAVGDSLLARLDQDLAAAAARVQDLAATQRPKVMFIYARGRGAVQVGGRDTFAETIIGLAGGQLATPDIEGFKPLNAEAVVAANPDYILLFDSGLQSLEGPAGLLALPGIRATTAGQQKQFISMDGALLANFGPRLGQAVRQLAESLHTSAPTLTQR